jgi:ribosome biogenesis GTPase
MTNGGWLIDMPGIRALRLQDAREGIDALFDDIAELAASCHFADCSHDTEPGCAIQAAIADDKLDPARLERWQKLRSEDARHSETIAEARKREKTFGKMIREVDRSMKGRKGR